MAAPPIYPELQGLTFDVVRRPMWSTGQEIHPSGRQTRIGYYQDLGPIYEWDLRYDVLRDFPFNAINSELKRLEGFFLKQQGRLTGFLFRDPDDCRVTAQPLGLTSGTNRYTLVRTFGDAAYGVTEPIGWVNLDEPFNLYLNGILQSTGYGVLQTETVPVTWDGSDFSTLSPSFADWPTTSLPYASVGNQILAINAPPGTVVAVDMSYYFYVRFGDDSVDFENFARQLWELKKVTLHSLRREFAAPDFSMTPPPPPTPPAPAIAVLAGSLSTAVDFVTTTGTILITTPTPNNIVVLHIAINQEGDPSHRQAPLPSISSVSGGGVTWARRSRTAGTVTGGFSFGDIFVASETWWAAAPTALTAAPVTITTNSDLAYLIATSVAVSGANLSSPWDTSGSLPAVATHLSGADTVPSVAGVTTTNPNDVLFFFDDAFSVISPLLAGPAGFDDLAFSQAIQAFIGLTVYTATSTKVVSGVVSETLTSTHSPISRWIATADAIRAA